MTATSTTPHGNVVLTYGDHVLRADSLTYNHATDDVTAEGHVELTGGKNDEDIKASHGTYNLRTETGRFLRRPRLRRDGTRLSHRPFRHPHHPGHRAPPTPRTPRAIRTPTLSSSKARVVVKTGPTDYTIYNGSVTTCLLPNPDWQLFSRKIMMDGGKARAAKSTFTPAGYPATLPPLRHPPRRHQQRQSGLLIPEFGYSSASKDTGSKGITIGEQLYLVLGRSADLTVGTIYYSLRGFSENGTFRYSGFGDNFFNAHFSALQDRGFYAPGVNAAGQSVTVYNNQGGVDITSSFRRQLTPNLRAVGDAEYLSSFIYREAFTSNFNQAVSTDITSTVYLTQQKNGFSVDLRFDRYEGLKVVANRRHPRGRGQDLPRALASTSPASTTPSPARPFSGASPPPPPASSASSRTSPPPASPGVSTCAPSSPFRCASKAGTFSPASPPARPPTPAPAQTPYGNNATPIQSNEPLNRADVDLNVDIRPPAIERTFTVPERWRHLFGDEVPPHHRARHHLPQHPRHRQLPQRPALRRRRPRQRHRRTPVRRHPAPLLQAPPQDTPPSPLPGCPAKPVTPTISGTESRDPPRPSTPPRPRRARHHRRQRHPQRQRHRARPAPPHPRRKPDPCAPHPRPAAAGVVQLGASPRSTSSSPPSAAPSSTPAATSSTPRWTSPASPSSPSRATSRRSNPACASAPPATPTSSGTSTSTPAPRNSPAPTPSSISTKARSSAASPTPASTPPAKPTPRSSTPPPTSSPASPARPSPTSPRCAFCSATASPATPGLSAAVSSGIDLNLGSPQYITVQTNYNWNCCGLSLEYRKYDLGTIRDEGAYSFNFTLANIGTAGNIRRAASLF